jgi:hypothetical protein
MSSLPGILTIDDTERTFINTVGQSLVFDAIQRVMAEYNAELAALSSIFIAQETEEYKWRFLLPGGGKMQRVGVHAPGMAVKRTGSWDVAFPLYGYEDQLGGNRVDLAYMSIAVLDTHLDNIMQKNMNTLRWRILTSLMEDTNFTFTDRMHGDLTIRRLANGDGTLYPPVQGSETEAEEDHYLNTGYTVANISDTNNPVVTARDDIAHHFGGIGSAGRQFAYIHGDDQTSYYEALTGFVPVSDQYLTLAGAIADSVNFPANVRPWPETIPGRVYGRVNGVWMSEYKWVPDKYSICLLIEETSPLVRRHDAGDTGLPRGLNLIATHETANYPLRGSFFHNRYGLGCGNRLNGVVTLIDTSGSYTPPTAYSE